MHAAPTDASSRRHLWGGRIASPLTLAAGITWLAVLLQAVDWTGLHGTQSAATITGLTALLVFPALFVLCERLDTPERTHVALQVFLAIAQGVCALAASAWLHSGAPAILLIIVAAQLTGLLPVAGAVVTMLVFNLLLGVVWLDTLRWPSVLVALLPMIGFQAFAGLVIHYAIRAERARDALARVNAELLATRELLQQSARSEERLRLSRELHDVAGHALTALKLNLTALQRQPHADTETLASLGAVADGLLTDLRAMVGQMRQHEGIDLRDALQALSTGVPGARVIVQVDDAVRAPGLAAATALLRCAQEGITNALRHGQARQVRVTCRQASAGLQLCIDDDGLARTLPQYGNGLHGMHERLQAMGGHLQLQLRHPHGLQVTASIPIADHADA